MFVYNDTAHEVVCKKSRFKGSTGELLHMAALMCAEGYVFDGRHWIFEEALEMPATLRPAVRAPGWDGTSVTLTGTIRPPGRGALARRVTYRVGDRSCTVVARGARRWVRQGRDLAPSSPEAWDPLMMSWTEAFGGTHPVEAGRDHTSGLPCPAYVARHPMNPDGKGFYTTAETAEGKPLPRIELLDDQIAAYGQWVVPGCLAPCTAQGTGLTLPLPKNHPLHQGSYETFLAPAHIAPSYLILEWQQPGTSFSIEGVENELAGSIPGPRIKLRARHKTRARYGARVRALHVDTDARRLWAVWQHAVLTKAHALPDVDVVPREAAS